MLIRFLLVVATFLISVTALAGGCLLTTALKDPALSANKAFWSEYSKLVESGKLTDKELQKLIEKYKGGASSNATGATPAAGVGVESAFQRTNQYSIRSRAQKEIKGLPANLREKVDEFLDMATGPDGLQKLRSNPARWNLEKIAQFGDNAYTVRLNSGYRVLFEVRGDAIDLIRVNKGQIHGN